MLTVKDGHGEVDQHDAETGFRIKLHLGSKGISLKRPVAFVGVDSLLAIDRLSILVSLLRQPLQPTNQVRFNSPNGRTSKHLQQISQQRIILHDKHLHFAVSLHLLRTFLLH